VRFETTVPLISNSTGVYHTFMDTVGRTRLTLTSLNVIDEFRDRGLVITYQYPFSARFRKPLVFFAGILAVFAVSWVLGNLDVSIGRKQKAT
jgi:oligosaccharyltransferase complex subunit alpha (ribophorin I)